VEHVAMQASHLNMHKCNSFEDVVGAKLAPAQATRLSGVGIWTAARSVRVNRKGVIGEHGQGFLVSVRGVIGKRNPCPYDPQIPIPERGNKEGPICQRKNLLYYSAIFSVCS